MIATAHLALMLLVGVPQPHWPDRYHLVITSLAAGVDPRVTLGVAWVETRANLQTSVRDHTCWYREQVYIPDSAGAETRRYIYHHARDCAVGRFQIRPSTARRRCPGLNVFRYRDNLACFLTMMQQDVPATGIERAIWTYNHSDAYVTDVLAVVGHLALAEETSAGTTWANAAVIVSDTLAGGATGRLGVRSRDVRAAPDGPVWFRRPIGTKAASRSPACRDCGKTKEANTATSKFSVVKSLRREPALLAAAA